MNLTRRKFMTIASGVFAGLVAGKSEAVKKLDQKLKWSDVYFDYHATFHFDDGSECATILTAEGYDKLRGKGS